MDDSEFRSYLLKNASRDICYSLLYEARNPLGGKEMRVNNFAKELREFFYKMYEYEKEIYNGNC